MSPLWIQGLSLWKQCREVEGTFKSVESEAVMTSSRRDLMLAYRWPVALVVSSMVIASALALLAWVALRVLSRPIPIAIEGGLQVDSIVLPPTVTIDATSALPVIVSGSVPLVTKSPLAIQGPLMVKGDVRTQAKLSGIDTPVSIQAVTVDGSISVKEPVRIDGKVNVDGTVNVDGEVKAKVRL